MCLAIQETAARKGPDLCQVYTPKTLMVNPAKTVNTLHPKYVFQTQAY